MDSIQTQDFESNYDTNFARITCLLMREGTERMKIITLRNLPQRLTLAQALQNNGPTFTYLKKKGIITESQYAMLFPFDGDMAGIDMTLWMVLARNITQKSYRRALIRKDSPAVHEVRWQDDFIRLKEIRNYLFHASSPELTEDRFNEIKRDLIAALKRLGSKDEIINGLLSRDLDPQQTAIYKMQMKQQYMEEKWAETAQRKQYTKILIGVMSILTLLVLAGICIVVVWYSTQKVPCEKGIIKLQSQSGLLNFLPRKGWGARDTLHSSTIPLLKTPVDMAVVFHTALVKTDCMITSDCCDVVRWLQKAQMDGELNPNVHWQDISYNYLIGDDGVVYEGRGSHYTGGASWHRNSELVSIALMGNYACVVPSRTALMALYAFLEYIQHDDPGNNNKIKKKPILTKGYRLYGQCQVNIVTPKHEVVFPDSPGAGTMGEIMNWNHWHDDNITQCNIEKDCLVSDRCCKRRCFTPVLEPGYA